MVGHGVVSMTYLQDVVVCRGLNEGWPKFWDELPRFA